MKFVCRKCDQFMSFSDVEPVSEGSLGVTFGCPSCGIRIAMVTNAGSSDNQLEGRGSDIRGMLQHGAIWGTRRWMARRDSPVPPCSARAGQWGG